MDVKTECPHCHVAYLVDQEHLGAAMRCEECHRIFPALPIDTSGGEGRRGLSPRPEHDRGPLVRQQEISVARANQSAYPVTATGALLIPGVDIEMLTIQPGSFLQGPAESGPASEDAPRPVSLTREFWIGKFLVNQSQYVSLMLTNPSYFQGDTLPVETVTWFEATEFCLRLTERERVAKRLGADEVFRLPTEAEWEYCCRTSPEGVQFGAHRAGGKGEAAKTPAYSFGSDPGLLLDYGWFIDNSGATTHPVGEKKPSLWGLYDMHGNVSGWCLDWYAPLPGDAATDPRGPATGDRKVRRGGSWASTPKRCRAADRFGVAPDCGCALLGFRIVKAASDSPPVNLPEARVW